MKWTGSKRPIAPKIISYFPDEIDTYYEPLVGGGSVFFELLRSGKPVKNFLLSDTNKSLIEILQMVQGNPTELILGYEKHWNTLQSDPDYFYKARAEYNQNGCPILFFFLTRTCYNGTIRYNSKGEFNTSFHFGRKGMNPEKIKDIVMEYHGLMWGKSIKFSCRSFDCVKPLSKKDVVYLDPPYTSSKSLYHGNINFPLFLDWVDALGCGWFMNMNGVNGSDNEEVITIPYTDKVLLKSGNSSFSRMKGKSVEVGEYFYYKKI